MEPSTPASNFARSKNQEKVSNTLPYGNGNAPWTLISVPTSEVDSETSQWRQKTLNGKIHIIGKYNDDAYEVIIDPVFLPELKHRRLKFNLEYNPLRPEERQKDVYSIQKATKKARNLWLCHAAHKLRSEQHREVQPAYYYFARLKGLHEALARAILIHDISTSTLHVRRRFAQTLVILVLSFETDDDSFETVLGSNEDDLLESLQLSLPIPGQPERTRRDEAQLTSLVRALLEFSGGRVEIHQHGFAPEYTVCDNANLYASILGITVKREFGDSDPEEICNALSKSPIFSKTTTCTLILQDWRMEMMKSLHIGFQKEHLNLPSRVLYEFGVGHLNMLCVQFEHIYSTLPLLRKPENNILVLITWTTALFDSSMDFDRQAVVLRQWANSEDGQNLYKQLVRDVQDNPPSVEQLGLNMAALMIYRRLCPDVSDDTDQPIAGSYLLDLDALFHGRSLGNSGRVAEQMVFAFIRVLRCTNQYKDLVLFLETRLDREPPLLYFLDGLADQYLARRIHGLTHKNALETVMEELSKACRYKAKAMRYPEVR